MAAKNAIERRIDDLVAMWNEFAADEEARVCRWLIDEDERQMIEAFVESQCSEAGEIPDLIVRFNAPFDEPDRYGFALVEELKKQYEHDRGALEEEGLTANWVCEPPLPDEHGTAYFVRVCRSFRDQHEQIQGVLAAYLSPPGAEPSAWLGWLERLLEMDVPEGVRVMVVDAASDPKLEERFDENGGGAWTITPELDMPAALQELAGAGDPREPGVGFRKQFVALTNAAAKGDLDTAKRAGRAALAIASEQGWPQMQVVAHMAMGAAFLGSGAFGDALQTYRAATKVGAEAQDAGDPAGAKLVIQSTMSEGSVLVADKQYAPAAEVYERAAALAEEEQDEHLALEGWRVAGFCHEQVEQRDDAWRCGHRALEIGAAMDEEARANSTVPYAAQGLMRVASHRSYQRERETLMERLEELLGPDWETKLQAGS